MPHLIECERTPKATNLSSDLPHVCAQARCTMVSKCLNPDCSTTFQYFGQGRLFRVDFGEASRKRALAGKEIIASVRCKIHPMEHFWLCERCAATMTIELSNSGEAHLVRIEASVPKRVPAAVPQERTMREAAAS